MKQPQQYIFWEPTASPHKNWLYEEFQSQVAPRRCKFFAHSEISAGRRRLGWPSVEQLSLPWTVAPTTELINEVVATSPDALHVVAGSSGRNKIVLRALKAKSIPFFIYAEPRCSDDGKGWLRYMHSMVFERWISRRSAGVLAIGINGPSWFKRVGFPGEKIHEFGYFVPLPEFQPRKDLEDRKLRICYVGRLIEKKGIRDLIYATEMLKEPAHLCVIGEGEDRGSLERLASSLGIDCEFRGAVPMNRVGQELAESDVLVLPSRSDDEGWGVVVNEALGAGAAVIVSNKAGAAAMIKDSRLGMVVAPYSSTEIAAAISMLQESALFSNEARAYRHCWALTNASCKRAAKFMIWAFTRTPSRERQEMFYGS
ncbi:glycosyltransferase involved in cell wall biosynthesis [Pseudacidovorax sp. 1753]|uniref:glycosyltransferase family 4 protein n=1 Tax=Pseudacidovorax sp. 1753 TaxID=3156419 RepID=UPI003395642C